MFNNFFDMYMDRVSAIKIYYYYYCPYLWLDMTKHFTMKLRVAYNNEHRNALKLRCKSTILTM